MKNKPVFNNIQNESYIINDKKIWVSRSPAVVGVVFIKNGKDYYVLTEKRSSIMLEPNKWAVVSGFLDWNENGYEAVIREIYEETGLYIPDYKNELIFDNKKEPFFINTDPKTDQLQNVSIGYMFVIDFTNIKFPSFVEKHKDKEIKKVKWLNLNDFLKSNLKNSWAFEHNKLIVQSMEYFLKTYQYVEK